MKVCGGFEMASGEDGFKRYAAGSRTGEIPAPVRAMVNRRKKEKPWPSGLVRLRPCL
jgi:hypothetical protein